ncbi:MULTISPECIES: hypothetical protein [unclassified Clostridium]|nr:MULTISPECIES: hypothetical protein [unclassified Clostridium]
MSSKAMADGARKFLIQQGLDPGKFHYIDRTCDNYKFRHIESNIVVDLRW